MKPLHWASVKRTATLERKDGKLWLLIGEIPDLGTRRLEVLAKEIITATWKVEDRVEAMSEGEVTQYLAVGDPERQGYEIFNQYGVLTDMGRSLNKPREDQA